MRDQMENLRSLSVPFRWMSEIVRQGLADSVSWGRVACLGNEVVSRVEPDTFLCNQQKVRVDVFCRLLDGAIRPRAALVKSHLARMDIYSLIIQQQRLPWLKSLKQPKLLVMDSFAELTDQEFRHRKQGWSFCSHYSDLNHSPQFSETFECCGLLPIDELAPCYEKFFTRIDRLQPGLKIIFIHFPTTLDKRSQFRDRGEAIRSVLTSIASRRHNLKNLTISDDHVRAAENDSFAYHFAEPTFQAFTRLWKNIAGDADANS